LSKNQNDLAELMSRPLTDADLERATLDMAAPLDGASHDRFSMLLFACGTELFAVASTDIAKVVPGAPIHRVPHRTNAIFRGVCNRDGELLLCVDLEAALGLRSPPEGSTRVQVVVGALRSRWAFMVDRVIGVVDVSSTSMRQAPLTVGAARSGCVTALATTPEGTASVLDLPRLDSIFRGAVS
jgi:chemotaxis-related protein WspD